MPPCGRKVILLMRHQCEAIVWSFGYRYHFQRLKAVLVAAGGGRLQGYGKQPLEPNPPLFWDPLVVCLQDPQSLSKAKGGNSSTEGTPACEGKEPEPHFEIQVKEEQKKSTSTPLCLPSQDPGTRTETTSNKHQVWETKREIGNQL